MSLTLDILEKIEWVGPGEALKVFINPSRDELRALAQSARDGVRALKDASGNWYVWDAEDVIHSQAARWLGVEDRVGPTTPGNTLYNKLLQVYNYNLDSAASAFV
jgi:hypothetical protein